jgi:hypothetical protein
MATEYAVNRRMTPAEAALVSASCLVGVGENVCLDVVTSEGRRTYVHLDEVEAQRLAITLERAIAGAFWGGLPQGLLIPHATSA